VLSRSGQMSVSNEMTLGQWLLRGSPSIVLSGLSTEAALHFGFRVSWNQSLYPSLILMALYAGFCVGLYPARKRSDGTYDLRLATGAAGAFGWIAGLLGMWYGGRFGIISTSVFMRNWLPFSVATSIATVVAVALAWSWGRNRNSLSKSGRPR